MSLQLQNDSIELSKKECGEGSPLRIQEIGLTCWMIYFQNTTTVYHSTIRMRPVDASKKENEFDVWENLLKDDEHHKKSSKFEMGETMRISRIKGILEHGFLPNWSEQIYKLDIINNSSPVTYILGDFQGEIIEESFYK